MMPTDELDDSPWPTPRPGFPVAEDVGALSIADLRRLRPRISSGAVSLPSLAIRGSAIEHNVKVMAGLLARPGIRFAPHAKTTLSPQLMRLQLDAGAWGITVANVAQARIARLAGAQAVLIANEVVGRQDIAWLAQRTRDETIAIVQVDSPAAVECLEDGLAAARSNQRLGVLVEVGVLGGRTGARGQSAVMATAAAVGRSNRLRLLGISTYEGVVGHDRKGSTVAAVDRHLDDLCALTRAVASAGLFDPIDEVLISAGGTRFVDRVLARINPVSVIEGPASLVIRAGSYLLYGHGAGGDHSPFSESGPLRPLQPALELWAEVLSVPESGLAIVSAGKRDVGERHGALVPALLVRGHAPGRSAARVPIAPDALTVIGLDDQHVYLAGGDPALFVGDRIRFDLCYPNSLDRSRIVPVVDDDDRITGAIATHFG